MKDQGLSGSAAGNADGNAARPTVTKRARPSGGWQPAMDIEMALDWAFRRQRVRQYARRYGGTKGLLHALSGDLPALGLGPGGGTDSVIAVVAGAVGISGGRGPTPPPVHVDAAVLLCAVLGLPASISSLVIDCAETGQRPDWGERLPPIDGFVPVEGYAGFVVTYLDRHAAYRPGPTNAAVPVVVQEQWDYSPVVNVTALRATARAKYVEWWQALNAMAATLTEAGLLRMTVRPPAASRQPWTDYGVRVPDSHDRVLTGDARGRFRTAVRNGASAAVLAQRFGISVKQAENLKKNMRRRGELDGPI